MKNLHIVAFTLLVVGGLNWLLTGLFDWGIVDLIGSSASRVVYVLVGLATIVEIAKHKQNCALCQAGSSVPAAPQAPTSVG